MTESTTIMVDPDSYGYGKPFPLFCRLDEFPPIGVAVSLHFSTYLNLRFMHYHNGRIYDFNFLLGYVL